MLDWSRLLITGGGLFALDWFFHYNLNAQYANNSRKIDAEDFHSGVVSILIKKVETG